MDVVNDARVIVGVSPSLSGLAALRVALAESRRRRMPLWAVRAWHIEFGPRARPSWEFERAVAADNRSLVEEAFRTAVGESPRQLGVVVRTPQGPAGVVLRDYLAGPDDLLVLGAPQSRWWGGRVLRAVTRGAVCPVIVVPPPELARVPARGLLREALTFVQD